MSDDPIVGMLPDLDTPRRPTALQPLLNQTVLVVDDSRYACEALRLMCLRSGARIRRADCLHSARRHLATYRPSVVIVDMGLPDGRGAGLISELAACAPRVPVLLAISGEDGAEEEALAAGADTFLSKPLRSLAAFQEAILSRLPAELRPSGPRRLREDDMTPDMTAYHDDLAAAADLIESRDGAGNLTYLAQFLSGVARSAEDDDLRRAVDKLASDGAMNANLAQVAALLHERLARATSI